VIEGLGHTVIAAADGPEGLALTLQRAPDALVVDMRLPTMDGWLVAEEARRALPKLLIIGVSAGEAGERERALASGCNAFVSKPYNLDVLRAALTPKNGP
jgi:CheY-like chemotaxis protein